MRGCRRVARGNGVCRTQGALQPGLFMVNTRVPVELARPRSSQL